MTTLQVQLEVMTTIHFLAEWALRSSVLIVSGALLLQALRVKDSSIRWAAWTAMLCASLAIPALTAALPKIPLAVMPAPHGRVEGRLEIYPAPLQPTHAVSPPDVRVDGHGTGASKGFDSARVVPRPDVRDVRVETPATPVSKPFDWARAAVMIYVLVALALLLRLGLGLVLSRRLLRSSRTTGRATEGIEIRESDRVATPVALGIAPSTIVLPGDWRAWNAAKLEAVLAHERSHIRRHDPAVQLLSAIHRALLWHSPLSWFLHRRIVRTAEEASDDAALAVSHDRASYAEVLLDFMQHGGRVVSWQAVPMARYGRADKRIHRILDGTFLSRGVTRWSLAIILAVGFPLAYLVAAANPQSAPQAQTAPVQASGKALRFGKSPLLFDTPPTKPSGQNSGEVAAMAPPAGSLADPQIVAQAAIPGHSSGSYDFWWKLPIIYIATDEEQLAFMRLTTDEEREQFIGQFWERRNPHPGSSENTFRQEYYRRVAYANQHYASAIPGWKTDRGHIYIVNGPPDEIDSHPNGRSYERPDSEGGGEASTFSFEQWRYRYIDGIGENIILEFVDATMTGEYRITLDPRKIEALWHVPGAGLTMADSSLQHALTPSQRDGPPITMCILIDNSGSMRDKRAGVVAASLALVEASKPHDEVGIVDFNDEASNGLPYGKDFTSHLEEMEEALTHIDSRGGSAMRGAIWASIDHLEQTAHNDSKVLVLVTDGNDTSSTVTQEQLLGKIKNSGVRVYCIGLLSVDDPRQAEAARLALGQLAGAAGGLAYYPRDHVEVKRISAELANEVRKH